MPDKISVLICEKIPDVNPGEIIEGRNPGRTLCTNPGRTQTGIPKKKNPERNQGRNLGKNP